MSIDDFDFYKCFEYVKKRNNFYSDYLIRDFIEEEYDVDSYWSVPDYSKIIETMEQIWQQHLKNEREQIKSEVTEMYLKTIGE